MSWCICESWERGLLLPFLRSFLAWHLSVFVKVQCLLDNKNPLGLLSSLERNMGAACSKLLKLLDNAVNSCRVSILADLFDWQNSLHIIVFEIIVTTIPQPVTVAFQTRSIEHGECQSHQFIHLAICYEFWTDWIKKKSERVLCAAYWSLSLSREVLSSQTSPFWHF